MKREVFVEEVAKRLVTGTLIPFVGAGFSHLAGYPLWKELLRHVLAEAQRIEPSFETSPKEVLAKLDAKLDQGDLQAVADYVAKHSANPQQLLRAVMKKYDKTPRIRTTEIAHWNCSHILTTNYDDHLEQIYTEQRIRYLTCTSSNAVESLGTKDSRVRIVHLHGSLDTNDSIVFSSRDIHSKLTSNKPLLDILSSVVTTSSLLFLGYSLQDPHWREIIKYVSLTYKEIGVEHFAILECDQVDSEIFKGSMAINTLRVDSFQESPLELVHIIGEITQQFEALAAGHRQRDDSTRAARTTLAAKFSNLAAIQKVHLDKRALLQLIVMRGLEIAGKINKTFNIHLVVGNFMVVAIEGGENKESRTREKVKTLDTGLIGKVYREKLPFFHARDVEDHEEYYDRANSTTSSEVIIPLKEKNDIIVGVLNIESSERDDFNDDDIEILKVVAAQTSIAIENKRKYDNMRAIAEISTIATRAPDLRYSLNSELRSIIKKTVEVLGFTDALVFYRSSDSLEFESVNIGYTEKEIGAITKRFREETRVKLSRQGSFTEVVASADRSEIEITAFCSVIAARGSNVTIVLRSNQALLIGPEEKNVLSKYAQELAAYIQGYQQAADRSKQLVELKIIATLNTIFENNATEGEVLESVASILHSELSLDWCFLHFIDIEQSYSSTHPKDGVPVFKLSATAGDIDPIELRKTVYSLNEGLTGKAAAVSSRWIISGDVANDPRSCHQNSEPFEARRVPVSTFLGVPIKGQQQDSSTFESRTQSSSEYEVLGVISALRARESPSDDKAFSEEDAEMLLRIATLLGKELAFRTHRSRQEKYRTYIEILRQAPTLFMGCTSEKELFAALSEMLLEYFGEQYFSVFRLDAEKHLLEMVAPDSLTKLDPPLFRVGQGLTGSIIQRGEEMFRIDFNDGMADCKDFWRRVVGTDDRYFLGTPIRHPSKDGYYGVLTLNGRRPHGFDPRFYEANASKVVSGLAAQITLGLRRIGY